jgi:hypothetical protein
MTAILPSLHSFLDRLPYQLLSYMHSQRHGIYVTGVSSKQKELEKIKL